jgi:hypothetical protein
MTNKEALEAFLRKEALDQPTVRRLMDARLITASDVTNFNTPHGQKEYLPIALTRRGYRILDLSQNKDRTKKRKVPLLKQLGSRLTKVRVSTALVLSVIGLCLTYKYNGAEELRSKVYSPLNAELGSIDLYLNAATVIQPFTGNAAASLKQNGYFYRIPKSLQREITDFYSDSGQIQMNVANLTDFLERQLSVKIQAIRSEQIDQVWRQQAALRLLEEEAKQPGISASRSFTFNHAARGRGVDVRDPNNPKVSIPGGPTWQINDWLSYPNSLEKVEPNFGDNDFLYFDDTRDLWYYRITRYDLEQQKVTLKEFLQPIYDKLTTDNDYRTIAEQRPKLLERLAHLRTQVTKRMDEPKSLFDLFDW